MEVSEGVSVVQIDEKDIGLISHIVHEKHHRCGGFFVHDNFDSAVEEVYALENAAQESEFFDYSIDQSIRVEKWIAQIDQIHLVQTIEKLASYHNRYYKSKTGQDSQNWIHQHWSSLATGRSDVSVDFYRHSGWPQPSVILTITGSDKPEEVVVLGGHADSIAGFWNPSRSRAPGADDNASGIASLTETLRVMLQNGYKPKRTIKFMAYAAEEVGLRGSAEIARDFKKKGVKIMGVLQLDMTNFMGSDFDIVLVNDYTNAEQNRFLGALVDTYLKYKWGYTSCGYACSDHASWHGVGYPASAPFEGTKSSMNRNIHTSRDTLDRSGGDAKHAAKFARLALAFGLEMAK